MKPVAVFFSPTWAATILYWPNPLEDLSARCGTGRYPVAYWPILPDGLLAICGTYVPCPDPTNPDRGCGRDRWGLFRRVLLCPFLHLYPVTLCEPHLFCSLYTLGRPAEPGHLQPCKQLSYFFHFTSLFCNVLPHQLLANLCPHFLVY